MKQVFIALIGFLFSIVSYTQVVNMTTESTYFDYLQNYTAENGDSIPKHIQRLNKRWAAKLAPSGNVSLAANAYYNYALNYDTYTSDTYNPNWTDLGPFGINDVVGGAVPSNGQIHNIVFDPFYNISNTTLYACSSFGGLFRSEDDGYSWHNVNTDLGIPISTVSDLAIHPTDSNTLFLATGYADGGIAKFVTGAGSVNPVFSLGVYRSTNYGTTWHPINSGLESMLVTGWTIREIEINPNNPNQIFIATDDGVYKTNNALASTPIWEQVIAEDPSCKGLEFKPQDTNTVYASGSDIYKSVDSGTTWESMTIGTSLDLENMLDPITVSNPDSGDPTLEDTSAYTLDRINITVTPAAPNRVYAYIEGTERYWSYNNTTHVWSVKKRDRLYIYIFNDNMWDIYHTYIPTSNYEAVTSSRIAIIVSPENPNAVYYPLVSDIVIDPLDAAHIWISYTGFNPTYKVYESTDAGNSWTDVGAGLPNLAIHSITYQKGTNDVLYVGTDAGVYIKNATADWEKYGVCPNVVVQDLKINYCNNKLRIATFGRGLWEADIIPFTGEMAEIVFEAGETVVWDNENIRGLRNSVRIKTGAQLTIKSEITMPQNGRIVVETGGKLILDGGKLTNTCSGLWKGILVEGNSSLAQTEANQGVLEVLNGGIIEYAEIGVLADLKAGGIIRVNNGVFRDNIIGIQMAAYDFANSSSIKNSTFETTNYLYEHGENPIAFIKLDGVHTIKITNNSFTNTSDFIHTYTSGKGIFAIDSETFVNNNSFTSLYKAIDLSATYLEVNNMVKENTFTGNEIATVLNNIDHVTFVSNEVDLNTADASPAFGLLLKKSNAFHVEDNHFFSTTGNFTVGTYAYYCQASNTIYRNNYDELKHAIYVVGDNTQLNPGAASPVDGLQFICNTFTDNEEAIYVTSNGRIATYQGEKENSSGNTFVPECSGSATEFNNLGTQITYFFDHIPAYEPLCNYNVNLFEAAVQNECASQLDNAASLSEITGLKTQKDTKETELQVLTDGGDTEGLDETVTDSEDDEALRLRAKLLDESPSLSEKVMLPTTSVEDVLPAIMVKDVLAANPKAAKSDKVQKALDQRQDPLPDYMRYEIDLGKEVISEKELLENELSKIVHTREGKINTHIANMLKDSVTNHATAIESLLVNENSLQRKYQLANHYITQGNLVAAQTVFTSILANFELSEEALASYNKRQVFFNLYTALSQEDKSWFDMTDIQRTIIDDLANDTSSAINLEARTVLALIENQDFGVPEITHETATPKSYNMPTEVYTEKLSVNPQVANDYFIIDYALDQKESVKEVSFVVYDSRGNKRLTKEPLTQANQYLTECAAWQEGVYTCQKIVTGNVVEEVQFVIDRTKSNATDSKLALRVYPNPANEYFIVQVGADYLANATIEVLDSKGALVQKISVNKDQDELLINTATWQSGIYMVHLKTNTKLVETFKIVIE